MEARGFSAALAVLCLFSLGAGGRTENFLVFATDPQLASEVAQAAEIYRRDLALQWLGRELPRWREPCPITVQAGPRKGAGGETSFYFSQHGPQGWKMRVQGTRQRILDSVLPHEITHTIFATHFRRPLPRWADEGACTTVEHVSERNIQNRFLIEFLTTERGIAFNRMFAMKEYPEDIMPLYSQGYSLARYLLAHPGGKRKFIKYLGDGMDSDNWPAATRKHYGYKDLSDLQTTWLDWVRQQSKTPLKLSESMLVQRAIRRLDAPVLAASQVPVRLVSAPAPPAPVTRSAATMISLPSVGWYAAQRDRAQNGGTPSVSVSVRDDGGRLR